MNTKFPLVNRPHTSTNGNSVIKCIAGNFSKKVLSIWFGDLASYIIAPDARRHAWHCWLSGYDGPYYADLKLFLQNSKSAQIVSDRYGCCPPGYLGALKRLGTRAREPYVYQGLFSLLAAGGHVGKLIHHCGDINDDFVSNLVAIPNDKFSATVASHLVQKSVGVEKLCGAVWLATRLMATLGATQVLDAVCRSPNPLRTLREMMVALGAFPSPPMAVEAPLFPVRSAGEIGDLAQRFRNCLRDKDLVSELVFSIQAGQGYLYKWEGDEPALILVKKFAAVGWVIEEAYGPSNRRLSEVSRRRIVESFGKDQSICQAWPDQMALPSYGWFFSRIS